ncbi:hypothetical protein BZM27_35615 [Paraburkholderia steynii]|uniref:Tyr recombinase domain-containing protein n=1 Tax=Paraburkholderia steynii TaxID=1245441 RepID=A0A4R0X5G5_9BURK|nr:hypothetical protein BZM27_35615 [Paraburkholderia steynii]
MRKRRKERSIPLCPDAARIWLHGLEILRTTIALPSCRGRSLPRNGVDYILQQAVNHAGTHCPSLIGKRISPRVVRHSTALLLSGREIEFVALRLGHESIETTQIYTDIDLVAKELALES